MQSLTQELKNAAVNGHITIDKAMAIAGLVDQERAESIALLKKVERQVGMITGEEVLSHIAKMEGSFFNSKDYHMERLPGEQ